MIKLYRLLRLPITIILVLTALHSGAQNLSIAQPSNIVNSMSKKGPQQKALGDTLYYEDFSDSTLSNWNAYSQYIPVYNWIWSKSAPGGQYSGSIGPLNSSSSSNGFISLPSDLYNTPALMFDPMDSWITSRAIPINPIDGIKIEYRHYLRYCCWSGSQIELQVSTDSLNWTSFDSRLCRPINVLSPNGERVEFNLNHVLAGEDTAYLRFIFSGSSHYFWMIDDLIISRDDKFPLKLRSPIFDPFPSNSVDVTYSKVPSGRSCVNAIKAEIINESIYSQANVRLFVDIFMDSTIGGGIGNGFLGRYFSDTTTLLANQSKDFSAYFQGLNAGVYKVILGLSSDSTNYSDLDTLSFKVSTDTVFSRILGSISQGVGPSYYNISANGDRIGVLFEVLDSSLIGSATAFSFGSISVFIANNQDNVGVSISPRIWNYYADTVHHVPVGFNPNSYTIQPTDLDTWVTLPYLSGVSVGNNPIVVGIEQTGGAQLNKTIILGRDEAYDNNCFPAANQFVYSANTTSGPALGWRRIGAMPAIRLNSWSNLSAFNCLVSNPVIGEQAKRISIFPNPTNGLINIQGDPEFDQLEVRDINGRLVHRQDWNLNDQNIDLSFLEDGLYFLRLRGVEERVEKIVIQH